jgi:hypothetical protein
VAIAKRAQTVGLYHQSDFVASVCVVIKFCGGMGKDTGIKSKNVLKGANSNV